MNSFLGTTLLEGIVEADCGERASAVVRLRPKHVGLMERAYQSLFVYCEPEGLRLAECAFLAMRTADSVGEQSLVGHYRGLFEHQLQATDNTAQHGLDSERIALLLRHTLLIATKPSAVTQMDVAGMVAAGLRKIEIVTLAQVVAFVSYQSRVICGLRIFSSQQSPTASVKSETYIPEEQRIFTLEVLRWQPWLDPVTLASATKAQSLALAKCGVFSKDSPYFRLLAHAPVPLLERTCLYNAILFDSGGLSRAEREFAAVSVSRVNGCIYCASVHARRFSDLTKSTALIQDFLESGDTSSLNQRLQAIQRFASKLTATPANLVPDDLVVLEETGFCKLDILDLIQTSALFAWANRLMLSLGEPESTSKERLDAQ